MRPSARHVLRWLAAAGLLALAIGCRSTGTFEWGDYDQAVLNAELSPTAPTALTKDIANLEITVERARARGALPGPGVHAHLGYLYTLQGDTARAAEHFLQERTLFPESTVMMDRLLEGLR